MRILHPRPEQGRQKALGVEFRDGVAVVEDLHPERERALLQHGFTIERELEVAPQPKSSRRGRRNRGQALPDAAEGDEREAPAHEFAVGDTVRLTADGREALGETDITIGDTATALGEVRALINDDARMTPGAEVEWSNGAVTTCTLSILELARDEE